MTANTPFPFHTEGRRRSVAIGSAFWRAGDFLKELITNYAVYIIEFLIVYIYFSSLFQKKRSTVFAISFGLILFSAISFVNPLFKNNLFINLLSFAVCCFVFSYVTFVINWKKSAFHSLIITTIMVISEFVAVFYISVAMEVYPSEYQTNYTIYIIDAVISKTIFLLCISLFSRFSVKNANLLVKIPISFFLYPICTSAILLLLRLISFNYGLTKGYNTAISIISFVLLFTTALIFISYNHNVKRENELLKLQSEAEKNETDRTYFDILSKQNEELQTFAHDTKNHLVMIKSLSDNEEINKYVSAIYDDLQEYSSVGKTHNHVLDVIINKYRTLCEVNNIDFQADIKNANLIFVEGRDLSTILNNVLDNAVESAKNAEKKYIYLTLKFANSFEVLTVVNSCLNKPNSHDGTLITTKNDARLHGYGTRSVKRTVAKYNGEYDWSYDETKKEFHLNIMFNSDKTASKDNALIDKGGN